MLKSLRVLGHLFEDLLLLEAQLLDSAADDADVGLAAKRVDFVDEVRSSSFTKMCNPERPSSEECWRCLR